MNENLTTEKFGIKGGHLFSAINLVIFIGALSALVFSSLSYTTMPSADQTQAVYSQHYWMTNLAFCSFALLICILLYTLYVHINSKKQLEQKFVDESAKHEQVLSEQKEQLQSLKSEIQVLQNKFIKAQRMASLGNLVGGVAHEVNTPIGMAVTLASSLQDETTALLKDLESDKLKRSQLQRFCQEGTENCQMLLSNLERAANLIRSFKQVAVDQSCGELRSFKISQYLNEVLLSLHPKLKKTQIQVTVKAPEDEQEVQTYPGALAQITTNLVMNSLIHAFDNGEKKGQILFVIEFENSDVKLNVSDDGKGMEKAVSEKIFDPYFTTKRSAGGSGLGLSIVYNLVVHQLRGSISCQSSPGSGTVFSLQFPMRVNSSPDE